MKLASAKVHFIGIGGIGMSGLAELLHNMGARVSGSDLSENAQVQHLKKIGVQIFVGHRAENIGEAEVVVYSSAVKSNNVEYAESRRRQIPLIARAEALAEIMRIKRGIAIGGSHGKTTTTSLTASIFLQAQLKPTIVVGGRLDVIKSTALLGSGDWMIAEADESDGSFTRLSPEIVVVTNIDNDHLDHYGSFENLQRAFLAFAARIPFYGCAIVCGDDPATRNLFRDFPKRIIFYGFSSENDYHLKKSKNGYEVYRGVEKLGDFQPNIFGDHNALNALAATLVGFEAAVPFSVCAAGIESFQGVDRRFQYKGKCNGALVYDDYGHHPTEVLAVLQAARQKFHDRRLVVAFQPHRYSRTQLCWDQFLKCFELADQAYIFAIYAAGESPLSGITSENLVSAMDSKNVEYVGDREAWTHKMLETLGEGDVIITLGAGDIWKVSETLCESGNGAL